LDTSNYDSFHGGGGGFSHVYVIMHIYFVKIPKMGQNKIKYLEKIDISALTLCCSYNYHKLTSN
jgi:hypothetical protein